MSAEIEKILLDFVLYAQKAGVAARKIESSFWLSSEEELRFEWQGKSNFLKIISPSFDGAALAQLADASHARGGECFFVSEKGVRNCAVAASGERARRFLDYFQSFEELGHVSVNVFTLPFCNPIWKSPRYRFRLSFGEDKWLAAAGDFEELILDLSAPDSRDSFRAAFLKDAEESLKAENALKSLAFELDKSSFLQTGSCHLFGEPFNFLVRAQDNGLFHARFGKAETCEARSFTEAASFLLEQCREQARELRLKASLQGKARDMVPKLFFELFNYLPSDPQREFEKRCDSAVPVQELRRSLQNLENWRPEPLSFDSLPPKFGKPEKFFSLGDFVFLSYWRKTSDSVSELRLKIWRAEAFRNSSASAEEFGGEKNPADGFRFRIGDLIWK